MGYKYRRNQIFGKRLKVPKKILNAVYGCYLSFNEYIEYQLEDKIPVSCLIEEDRKILEKFSIERCRELDWEIINRDISFKDMLISIDSKTENINLALYELVKNQIEPEDYSRKMAEIYSDRLFEISLNENDEKQDINNLKVRFNRGKIKLDEIISNWELFEDKDLSYCLLKDKENINGITDSDLKQFMVSYRNLSQLIFDNGDIYTFVNDIVDLESEKEKNEYVKHFTDDILSNIGRKYGSPTELTNEQYKEIFKYSSLEDYLKLFNSFYASTIMKELRTLPQDYIFNMSIPFSELLNHGVLSFVGTYGLRNIVDFDNECGHFFTSNNCRMLRLMYDMYLHYANNEYDTSKTYFTKNNRDEKGNYVDRPYTKDEFYEAMRRMMKYGPTDQASDYRNVIGEFRVRNAELFISEEAPEELQKSFYTKSITPKLLLEHPEYIHFLNGKDLSSCFKNIEIYVDGSDAIYGYENFYSFVCSKTDFDGVINFITEYSDVLDIVFGGGMSGYYLHDIRLSINDDINIIQNKMQETLRQFIIKKGLSYPTHIPKDFIVNYPTMFLDKKAPQELQEAFYGRTITSEFISSNPIYKKYLVGVDLECLFKYMPVSVVNGNEPVNMVRGMEQIFDYDSAFNFMILYGKCIEKIYEDNKLSNFKFDPNFSIEDLLDETDKVILQNIIDGNMKYDENIPNHFKNNNPTLFLNPNVSQEIKNKFYNREFRLEDFDSNPYLIDIFGDANIVCGFSENVSWMIPLYSNSINSKIANFNRLKMISAYSKIQDVELQSVFKEFVIECETDIDAEKIEYVSEILLKLSLSNSSEIFTFRKELATQILKSQNPLESLNKIEDVFIRNNIPTVGKIYSCFEILHPDFQGFNFEESSTVSPMLKKSSIASKKVIVFSDLIKCSFGSNNRSINSYLKNIEFGYDLYEKIRLGQVGVDLLNDNEVKELTVFSKHLATLYNNTMKAKKRMIYMC